MAGTAVGESVTEAGRVERARVVRAFVGGCSVPGTRAGMTLPLLVTEFSGNSHAAKNLVKSSHAL